MSQDEISVEEAAVMSIIHRLPQALQQDVLNFARRQRTRWVAVSAARPIRGTASAMTSREQLADHKRVLLQRQFDAAHARWKAWRDQLEKNCAAFFRGSRRQITSEDEREMLDAWIQLSRLGLAVDGVQDAIDELNAKVRPLAEVISLASRAG